jgi:short-subunit dehydrogenase
VLQELRQRELEPDILINKYGFTRGDSWQDTDEALWLEMYQVNALSAIRLAQALAPLMKNKR